MRALLTRPALELADLVRRGEVSPVELTGAALAAAEEHDRLGAFVHLDPDAALAAARAVSRDDPRPFAGVPTAIKDNRWVEGWPLTFGSNLAGDLRAPADQALVTRLRAAGFVLIGKTSLPEFGILPTSEPSRFGPARNPYDPEYTPGGSSGGSAAAVAAGILPVAHGNDGGGSIRIPAACCGLVGLKPARGRVSQAPVLGESFLVEDGMLTRTVADSAALLDVLAGPEPGDVSWAAPPAEAFATAAARTPARLRIAATVAMPIDGVELDPRCESAWAEAADALRGLGHEVEAWDPPWSGPGVLGLFTAEFGAGIATNIAALAAARGLEPRAEDVEALSWFMWERASALGAVGAALLHMRLAAFARGIIAAAAPYDAILTPALAERPPRVGTMNGALPDPDDTFRRSGRFTPYTATANATGLPAIALPWRERDDDGLPTGVQLIGRPEGEGPLLALAAQLEAARA